MTDEEKAAAELAEKNTDASTEINEDDLLAAVSAAVDEQTITPEKDDDDDSTDDDGTVDADGELSPDGEPGADKPEGDPEESPEGKSGDEDGDKSEDDGTEGSGDAATETSDKSKETDKDGSDAATVDVDPVNDPIPEATNEKTAARIKSLIGLVKDQNESTAQRDEIVDRITDTGADPEQYSNTLGFLKLYNSPDIKDRKQALLVARGMVKELALDVGEGASVTKLEDHDDLQAEVEAGTLTEKRAIEIAATRERQTMDDARKTAANEKTETANQTQQNIAVGKGQLDDLETALRVSEKDYAALRPMFVGLLKPILRRVHPSEWGTAAREVFDQVRLANPVVAPKPKPKPRHEPLRPGSGGGGGVDKTPEGGDALSAVNDALANM